MNGRRIPWSVTPICETSQIYYLMGRRPMKGRFGQPYKGPIIPFGSLVEYHPKNCTMRDVNRETITGYAVRGNKILPLNGFNLIRAKQKTSQETAKSLRKFSRAVTQTKSCLHRQLFGIWESM